MSVVYAPSQLGKEALAVVFGADYVHQYLWGIPFQAHTDHKLGTRRLFLCTLCLEWALNLSAYKHKLLHKPGRELGPALPLPNDSTEFSRPAETVEEATPLICCCGLSHEQ